MKISVQSDLKYKKRLIRRRPFILLGNEVDGRTFCNKFFEFKNLTNLKKRLPSIMTSISGEGEWVFELYQVPRNYRIWHRYGYYKYPNRGTKILKYDYCNCKIQNVVFKGHEIEFVGASQFLFKGLSHVDIEIASVIYEWQNS